VLDPIDFKIKLKGVMSDAELESAKAILQSEKIE